MASSILSKYRSDLANAITDPDSIGVMLCKRGVFQCVKNTIGCNLGCILMQVCEKWQAQF